MELVMESVPLHNLVSWYNSAMLCRKLYSETSRTKEFAPVKLEFPFFFFFWSCAPAQLAPQHKQFCNIWPSWAKRLFGDFLWSYSVRKHGCVVLQLNFVICIIEIENDPSVLAWWKHARNPGKLHEHLNFPKLLRCLHQPTETKTEASSMAVSMMYCKVSHR